MESVGTHKPRKASGSGTRRTWKHDEEVVLMELLKELVAIGGWKTENGFRTGFLQKLEDMLKEKIKNTDLRGVPNIQSKITIWKRHHVAIQTALRDSGGGFNTETKILDVSEVAWDKAVKREPSVATMRYKPWPFYYDWLEVFGNDGATGGCSQTVIDAVNEVVQEDAVGGGCANQHSDANNAPNEGDEPVSRDVESEAPNVQPFPPGAPVQPNKSSKSTTGNNKELLDCLGVLFKTSDDRLDQIVHSIVAQPQSQPQQSHPQADSTTLSRTQVFKVIEIIGEFTLDECLAATEKIAMNVNRLELFSGIPDHGRLRYVRRLLDGDFDNPI